MNSKAFTLIELLVVISILGLLASMVLISMEGATDQAEQKKAMEFSHTVRVSLGADLVGEWRFDQGSGTEAKDSSGYDNDGTLVNFVGGWTDDGIFGKALVFDGEDGDTTGDYVIKNPVNDFPTTEITVEFWMKSSDTTKDGTPISYGVTGNTNEFMLFDYTAFRPHIKGSSISTGVSATDGIWHHIVCTWRSFDGQLKFYKDGEEEFSGTIQAGATLIPGGSLVLGQEQDGMGTNFDPTQAFLGIMDEVRIYNRVLSSAEIQQHYVQEAGKYDIALK